MTEKPAKSKKRKSSGQALIDYCNKNKLPYEVVTIDTKSKEYKKSEKEFKKFMSDYNKAKKHSEKANMRFKNIK